MRSSTRWPVFLGVTFASAYSLYYVATATRWHFIDYADLIFHEAGHVLFMFFGEFLHALMGSGLQILLPLCISLYFFYHRQIISGAICLMWTGMNFINVSLYAGDALTLQLPLLGGDNVRHDWNYLLSALNMLHLAPVVASTLFSLGCVVIAAGIILAYKFTVFGKRG
ncbi:MAG TPA: hypothetical protein VGE31_01600 [Candidatus Paceibacterota bacterium]